MKNICPRFLASFMVWTSILIVFLGTGSLLGYSGYRLYFAYLDTDPEAQKNIFEVMQRDFKEITTN